MHRQCQCDKNHYCDIWIGPSDISTFSAGSRRIVPPELVGDPASAQQNLST